MPDARRETNATNSHLHKNRKYYYVDIFALMYSYNGLGCMHGVISEFGYFADDVVIQVIDVYEE